LDEQTITLKEAAERAGVSPDTLRRWAKSRVIPEVKGSGDWTPAAVSHARIVARLRERGHSLSHIREAGRQGRLAYGFIEELFPHGDGRAFSIDAAAEATGLEPALVERFWVSAGLPPQALEETTEEDVQALQYMASVLAAGFPLVAFLQDVVGHMELELEGDFDLGRIRVAIAFVDLAGHTRFTEEEGDEEALSVVERFIEGVTETLPDDARVVKTIGDEVMVVGQDVRALTEWAVGFQRLFQERPEPRIGLHYGPTIYRDGDYLGREVNLASRVVARARGGEVIVTDAVQDAVSDLRHLDFEQIGQVKLKGFDEPRTLCRVASRK
jgi:class 3 adenylate cyclase/lambda repressor-like predicted transcriptional regulator